jgi:sulfite exporter TauE/SafE
MALWTAFLLGLVGSLHCVGMCGPLALALPVNNPIFAQFLGGRLLYNLGRITTYAALGGLFGLLGKSFIVMGVQRWVSLSVGIVILVSLILSPRFRSGVQPAKFINLIKSPFLKLMRHRGLGALFGIGLLNGLLPCGLVYAACAAAMTSDTLLHGAEYMIAFGLGTIPMMLAITLMGQRLQFILRFKLQRLIPISLAIIGALLVLRGMALGIPHFSPKLSIQADAVRQCCQGR